MNRNKIPEINTLFRSVKILVEDSRKYAARNVNVIMVCTYFHIGRLIVEKEQKGQIRASYAKETLKNLSIRLSKEFGRGFSVDNLQYMRMFYLEYAKSETLSRIFNIPPGNKINYETLSRISDVSAILSWSHYIQLLKIKDKSERSFYEIEAIRNSWSIRELQRQYHSSLYERLALSRDKKAVEELALGGQIIAKPTDTLKNPYVLEFLDLKEDSSYSESELETAIIDKLEHFLRELLCKGLHNNSYAHRFVM